MARATRLRGEWRPVRRRGGAARASVAGVASGGAGGRLAHRWVRVECVRRHVGGSTSSITEACVRVACTDRLCVRVSGEHVARLVWEVPCRRAKLRLPLAELLAPAGAVEPGELEGGGAGLGCRQPRAGAGPERRAGGEKGGGLAHTLARLTSTNPPSPRLPSLASIAFFRTPPPCRARILTQLPSPTRPPVWPRSCRPASDWLSLM